MEEVNLRAFSTMMPLNTYNLEIHHLYFLFLHVGFICWSSLLTMIHHLLEPYLPQLYGISSNDNTRVEVSKKIVNAIENQNEQLRRHLNFQNKRA